MSEKLRRNPEWADWWEKVDRAAADAPVLKWEDRRMSEPSKGAMQAADELDYDNPDGYTARDAAAIIDRLAVAPALAELRVENERLSRALREGPKIGSVVMRGDDLPETLEIVTAHCCQGAMRIVVRRGKR